MRTCSLNLFHFQFRPRVIVFNEFIELFFGPLHNWRPVRKAQSLKRVLPQLAETHPGGLKIWEVLRPIHPKTTVRNTSVLSASTERIPHNQRASFSLNQQRDFIRKAHMRNVDDLDHVPQHIPILQLLVYPRLCIF